MILYVNTDAITRILLLPKFIIFNFLEKKNYYQNIDTLI